MATRNHALTGCGACRMRHLKCDEARPRCQLWQIGGLVCPGYTCQLKWSQGTESPQNEETEERIFRRPLFSVDEQDSVTQSIVDSLGKRSTSAALAYLDRKTKSCTATALSPNSNLFQGLFNLQALPCCELTLNDDDDANSVPFSDGHVDASPCFQYVDSHYTSAEGTFATFSDITLDFECLQADPSGCARTAAPFQGSYSFFFVSAQKRPKMSVAENPSASGFENICRTLK
ncbi:uncharacterized protein BO97DRAFT_423237 [Aspergillus homomorphus CBS 101889]|uniref:Zn(2)-C6 fungal-type domain-containing protein n=1 Tax=Aspergillus homomorphus (strain CBS 101889) TaxID=1450537 RepID=A0A395I6F7_ASPHC|nr:hypothetical protein BO97DRAFT_423237 [Aspergillus homomorphus CBS 101889]RAL13854.1 hypothetical protein BO97DRAFT_423237 [Aspergillus homomorphus CBS 101889]